MHGPCAWNGRVEWMANSTCILLKVPSLCNTGCERENGGSACRSREAAEGQRRLAGKALRGEVLCVVPFTVRAPGHEAPYVQACPSVIMVRKESERYGTWLLQTKEEWLFWSTPGSQEGRMWEGSRASQASSRVEMVLSRNQCVPACSLGVVVLRRGCMRPAFAGSGLQHWLNTH
eukprot:1156383-Pelagomonas_calceolata.AAC.6